MSKTPRALIAFVMGALCFACGGDPDSAGSASGGKAGTSSTGGAGGAGAVGSGGASAGGSGGTSDGGSSGASDGGSAGESFGGSGGLGTGIPFGPFFAWETGSTLGSGMAPFDTAIGFTSASTIVAQIDAARASKMKVILAMTGGAHSEYLTDGVFDLSKWKARMDTFDKPEIKTAVAAAVADGTIVGNQVMDEPMVHGLGDGNTWGPIGTMTKAKVDQLCAYQKAMFPTLPAGPAHQHHLFEPTKSYQVCDFIIDQYSQYMGDVAAYRDAGLALAKRDGHAIMFSINIINGGIQAPKAGPWECPLTTTGGKGGYAPNCRMTAKQVRDFGKVLGVAGCAMAVWRRDDAFMAKSDNEQAFQDVADLLATRPRVACSRP